VPIEPVKLTSASGIALTDESRESIAAADFARSINFATGALMIEPFRRLKLHVSTGALSIYGAVAMPDGRVVAITDAGVLSVSETATATISTSGVQAPSQTTTRRSGALMRSTGRIAGSPVWYTDGSMLQHASLLRPVITLDQTGTQTLRRTFDGYVASITYTSVATNRYELRVVFYITPYSLSERDLLQAVVGQRTYLELLEADETLGIIPQAYTLESLTENTTQGRLELTMLAEGEYRSANVPSNWTGTVSARLELLIAAIERNVGNYYARLFYACTFEYDGFQEGPLSDPVSILVDADTTNVKLSLQTPFQVDSPYHATPQPLSIDSRITAVHVYRARSTDPTASKPESAYTYVARLDLSQVNQTGSVQVSDYIAEDGLSYTERTGLPDTLDTLTIEADLLTSSGKYMFYGGVRFRTGPSTTIDEPNVVVRSQPYRADMVNWLSDRVVLTQPPTAMQATGNRLFVWTARSLYVFSEDLSLLEELPGLGTDSQEATTAWPQGVAWLSDRGMWVYDGASLMNLGSYLRSEASALQAVGAEQRSDYQLTDMSVRRVLYVPSWNAIVFYGGAYVQGVGQPVLPWAWIYFLQERQLVLLRHNNIENLPELVINAQGKPYLFVLYNTATGAFLHLAELFADTTAYESYLWRSVDLARGERLRFHEAYVQLYGAGAAPSFRLYYSESGSGSYASVTLTATGTGDLLRYRITPPLEARRLHIELEGTAPVDSIMLRIRRLGR